MGNSEIKNLNHENQMLKTLLKKSNNDNNNINIKQSDILPIFNCDLHKNEHLSKICLSSFCLKSKLLCNLCAKSHHNQHEILEIQTFKENSQFLIQQLDENTKKEVQSWNQIQQVVENNAKYLQKIEELISTLSQSCQKLQQTLKIVQEKQITDQLSLKQNLESLNSHFSQSLKIDQSQISQEINLLLSKMMNFQMPKVIEAPQIVDVIEFNCQFANYTQQSTKDLLYNIKKSDELQQQVEQKYAYSEFQLINQMKREKDELQLNNKVAKVFHLIKGKAKKRDIINFVNWEEEKRELKFMKDIKEKEENSHYQLVFSLYLKNLDFLEETQINETLMLWLNDIIVNKYPEVKKQKEEQRRNINTKDGNNKRKYCKFNPRFDIDLKNYQLQLQQGILPVYQSKQYI
ncbi:hypothetical protein PPERSA_00597 [Pseudocohnilembus persalinus]|uniref:Uncharacterized protein n=1 Tax=Pseudocohnilembus persalinus TaxID=266149 RepID=A0A0V0QTH0_PSEPJ|nr:hypothetical protein PPERSA_00597 [Pseudocohnilembus persalinus]|eukprot:KRX05296.1 hypothetical protein PPERSA_00597 [Pseudocohnilembus persalinus]